LASTCFATGVTGTCGTGQDPDSHVPPGVGQLEPSNLYSVKSFG
jgi:hypothetical protein